MTVYPTVPAGGAPAPLPGQLPETPTAMPAGETVVQAVDLVKVYGTGEASVRALDQLNASFQAGSFTAIMGPSGSGKSTLMHLLAGLDRVTSGRVFLAGQELTAMSERQLTALRRDQIGFIFQQFNLLPTLTAEQNILLPLELAGKKPDRAFLAQLVESLQLQNRLRHLPAQLSGGQQQRVAVARALVGKPQVVFADEPTGALDSRNSQALLGYLRSCSQTLRQTIIMVTHDPNAAAYADRALILSDGRIVDDLYRPTADLVLSALRSLGA